MILVSLLRIPFLGCLSTWDFSGLVVFGDRDFKWLLGAAHHILCVVQLLPWPGPKRMDSAEEKRTYVKTEEQIAADGADRTARVL